MTQKSIEITPELIAAHGLTESEYQHFLKLIDNREPTITELGIVSAMWNEHCSYKSSKKWLKTLPTRGECVIMGPGENAGVVDIGDNQAVIFKMESHNHPSYIEPYQGAATGVGGILRDVFTMGARPIATMNALRFGEPSHPKTRSVLSGVVAGIGGYGNSFGVPNVGGEVEFHHSYNGNCLVNAFAAGLADKDKIFTSEAKGVGLPVVYLGAKTGRDGVGGATMASAEFDDSIEEKRPTVQVGDPFTEKCLLEATLELMQTGAVIAIQDMGAAGLTCSAVEMGAKGGLGIELDLDNVPCREEKMSAYEMMLSESQERMLMVLDPDKHDEAEAVFKKWDLDFAIVGKTTNTKRFIVMHQGQKVADLPINELGDEAPEYDRPYKENVPQSPINASSLTPPHNYAEVLLKMLSNENFSSRRWVWEQYDTLIQGNAIVTPGADAGVVKVHENGKGLAFSVDVTPRYCKADPFEGGKQAVAEVWRNLTCVGAKPLAITDNLNFGNPERPEIMGQFVGCIKGIGEACKKLNFPVVSGNVSLYNETKSEAIMPTPAIAGVGLIDNIENIMTPALKNEGDAVMIVGGHGTHFGSSAYLRDILGREEGAPPPTDLDVERRHGDFIRDLISKKKMTACHDISDGGLLIALAEMALIGNKGVAITLGEADTLPALLSEDQGRYIITTTMENSGAIAAEARELDIPTETLGKVTGDNFNILNVVDLPLTKLRQTHERWFKDYVSLQKDIII